MTLIQQILKDSKKTVETSSIILFFYLKSSKTLFTEGSDIMLKNDSIEIKMRNGKMNVDIENRAVLCDLTKNRKSKLKP